MSRFTDHLGLELLEYSTGRAVLRDGRCLWRLATPLTWEVGDIGSGVFITVPAFDPSGWTDDALRIIRVEGVTDLASIPALVRGLLPPDGPWAKAAVLHDAGYVTRGWGGRKSRKEVDDLLNEAMKALGVPSWKRWLIYNAVRMGGAGGWARDARSGICPLEPGRITSLLNHRHFIATLNAVVVFRRPACSPLWVVIVEWAYVRLLVKRAGVHAADDPY